MNLSENIRIALRALSANKVRSALTMLGIVIGVGAVVALLAIGQGATQSITSQVEGLGSNMLTILPARSFQGLASGQTTHLYYADYEAIAANVGNEARLAPVYQTRLDVKYGSKSVPYSLVGTTPEFATVRAYQVQQGRFLTDRDGASGARVAVLGSQAAEELFGSVDPVGRTIKIDGVSFEVVGALAAKGSSGMGSSDDLVIIPLETGYTRLFGAAASDNGRRLLSNLLLSTASPEAINNTQARVEFILRKQHRLAPTAEPDFSVMSQQQFLDTLSGISTTLTIFLGAIAAISLLVGGIGIMNIMLVSVSERTREIGLRKAVGARRATILVQFLVETLTLSLLGGLLGIALGVGVAAVFSAAGLIAAQVSAGSVLLAFLFALGVGLFFGIYPAYRASSLRPIEALRYE